MISIYVGYGYGIGYNPKNLLTKIKLHLQKKKILDSSTKTEIFSAQKARSFSISPNREAFTTMIYYSQKSILYKVQKISLESVQKCQWKKKTPSHSELDFVHKSTLLKLKEGNYANKKKRIYGNAKIFHNFKRYSRKNQSRKKSNRDGNVFKMYFQLDCNSL